MTEANYRTQIRGAVRGLWKGVLSFSDFSEAMQSTITRGMTQAWTEGARECGIAFDELSEGELTALKEITEGQFEYIEGFRDFIDENSKPNAGKLDTAFKRSSLWINRYLEAVNQAKTMACKDQKLKWVINARGKGCREHCSSCMKLNGKVKRASYWDKVGIRPQSSVLECGGWRCCCGFEVTSEPVYRGQIKI